MKLRSSEVGRGSWSEVSEGGDPVDSIVEGSMEAGEERLGVTEERLRVTGVSAELRCKGSEKLQSTQRELEETPAC